MTGKDTLDDKSEFIKALYGEDDHSKVLNLIGRMGIGPAELGTAIGATDEEVQTMSVSSSGIYRHKDEIDLLKSATLWLLERGILTLGQTALAMTSPDEQGQTLLSLIAEGDLEAVIHDSRALAFTRPKPILDRTLPQD